MNDYKVSAHSYTDDKDYDMTNRKVPPLHDYRAMVPIPPNETDDIVIHSFELKVNGNLKNVHTEVVVLNDEQISTIAERLFYIDDALQWNTFDKDYDDIPLDFENLTIRDILTYIITLENATSVGSFNIPSIDGDYNDDYEYLLKRISILEDCIEWG